MLLYSENIEVCNVCQHANRTVNSAITRTNITHHKLNHNSFKNIVNGKRRQEGGSRREARRNGEGMRRGEVGYE